MKAFVVSLPKGKKRTHTQHTNAERCDKPSKQMQLDLGQKDLDARSTCEHCHMTYIRTSEEDKKEHQRFCNSMNKRLHVSNVNSYRKLHHENDDIVILISPGNTICIALQQALETMEQELGSSPEEHYSSCALLFYLRKLIPIGAVVLEEVAGDRLRQLVVSKSSPMTYHEHPASANNSSSKTLGVRQIWVNKKCRRQGIAKMLLNIACETRIFGMLCRARSELAFSQPTSEGVAFAASYVNSDIILGY